MKRFKYLFSGLVLGLFAITSCDVLNEEIVSGITVDQHYAVPQGFQDAVRATYNPLRSHYGQETGLNLTVHGTDEFGNGGHGGNQHFSSYNTGLNAGTGTLYSLWSNFYVGINTANAVVARAPEADVPEAIKAIRLGEVRFLRAHYYFKLTQHFGDIHLTLEETQGVETEANRTDESIIYETIVADLEFAIANLPVEQDDYGRVTKPAAEMALAHVLLTRGQSDFAESDDLSRAVTLAETVIAYPHLNLLDNYADVWDHDNERHEEVVFSVQYSSDPLNNGGGNNSHVFFRPWYENTNSHLRRIHEPGYGRPWIRVRPTQWGLDNLRSPDGSLDHDTRYYDILQDTWYYNNENNLPAGAAVGDTAIYVSPYYLDQAEYDDMIARLPGARIFSWHSDNMDDDWYYPINQFPSLMKFDDWKRVSVNEMAGSRDFYIYRLAEAYLFAAEAHIAAGNNALAVPFLNEVRERAGTDANSAALLTAATPAAPDMDFLLAERARELYGEYKRWEDLKRTGTLEDRVTTYGENFPSHANRTNFEDKHWLRPIPEAQITRTSNVYGQNDGY